MTLVEYKVGAFDAEIDKIRYVVWAEIGAVFKWRVVGEALFYDVGTFLNRDRREKGFRVVWEEFCARREFDVQEQLDRTLILFVSTNYSFHHTFFKYPQ